MCHLLASCLAKSDSHSAYFALPGTHGVIYPWAPPPHIEVGILKQLHTELRHHFECYFPPTLSHTSSPASVASSLREEKGWKVEDVAEEGYDANNNEDII